MPGKGMERGSVWYHAGVEEKMGWGTVLFKKKNKSGIGYIEP